MCTPAGLFLNSAQFFVFFICKALAVDADLLGLWRRFGLLRVCGVGGGNVIVAPQGLRGGLDGNELAVLFSLPLSHIAICAKIDKK